MTTLTPIRSVDVDGVGLAYREWGTGGDGLLLIHGITSSSLAWARVGPALGRRFRVIAPDLKGHGDSDRPSSGYRLEDQAAEVRALIERLGLGRPRVIGHSWGGAIALTLASSGDAVERLVLEDPALLIEPSRLPEVGASFAAQVGPQPVEALRETIRRDHPNWADVDVEGKVDAQIKASPEAVRAVFTENASWDLLDRFARLRCPTLLLRAPVESGGIVGAGATCRIAEQLGESAVVTVESADHSIHRSRYDDFMRIVEPFLTGAAPGPRPGS